MQHLCWLAIVSLLLGGCAGGGSNGDDGGMNDGTDGTDRTDWPGGDEFCPVVNYSAFEAGQRVSAYDLANLNRNFPGKKNGFFTQRLAHVYFDQVVRKADYIIDLHGGGNIMALAPMAIYREIGDRRGVAISLTNQGNISCKLGEYSEARQMLQVGLQVAREINDLFNTVYALYFLGDVALGVEEYEEAGEHYRAALRMARQIRSIPLVLACLFGVATVLAKVGGQEKAVEVLALIPEHPSSIRETIAGAERLFAEIESQLPAQVMAEALERGKAREFEEVVEELLAEA